MTLYKTVNVNISEGQKQKLKHSINANCAATSIKLGKNDLEGEHKLALTNSHYNRLQKAKNTGKGITIRMSSKQLKHNLKTEGGFLPLLAGLAARALPMIAKTVLPALGVGALSGLASSGVQKAMGSGLYLKRGGMIAQIETDGEGLYLKPYKGKGLGTRGNGLYLKRGGKIYDGSGILTSIPIIGDILKTIF